MTLKYPDILDETNSPFFKISCIEWKALRKKDQDAKTVKTIIEEIFLPMSKNGLTEPIINNWDISDNITKDSISDFAKSGIANKIVSALPEVTKYLSYQRGEILNDFSALTFSGNNFREFNFADAHTKIKYGCIWWSHATHRGVDTHDCGKLYRTHADRFHQGE